MYSLAHWNGDQALPKLDDILRSTLKHDVNEDPMVVWDKGVFLNQLLKQGIALNTSAGGRINGGLATDSQLKKGTYKGTQLALTELYSMIEEAAVAHLNFLGIEYTIPAKRDLKEKQAKYEWSNPADDYPPHVSMVPSDQQYGVGEIFDKKELGSIQKIGQAFGLIV